MQLISLQVRSIMEISTDSCWIQFLQWIRKLVLEKKSCLPRSTNNELSLIIFRRLLDFQLIFVRTRHGLLKLWKKHLHDYGNDILLPSWKVSSLSFQTSKTFVIPKISSLNGKQRRLVKGKNGNSYSSNFVDVFRFYQFHSQDSGCENQLETLVSGDIKKSLVSLRDKFSFYRSGNIALAGESIRIYYRLSIFTLLVSIIISI